MNKVNHDSEKFDVDKYGNLIPKCIGITRNSTVPANLEQDTEIINEYGLNESQIDASEIHRPHKQN